jgi:hypothetical protein
VDRLQTNSVVNRYYDPSTGQFLSVDSRVDETGTPYTFTDGDPVNNSDPNGEMKIGPHGELCGSLGTPQNVQCITPTTSSSGCQAILRSDFP